MLTSRQLFWLIVLGLAAIIVGLFGGIGAGHGG